MEEFNILGVPLKDIHKVQIEMLDEVDRICKKNNIKYFLSGGTLLGAARHKGFIPWDDDVDLWMTRKNYKKFKKAAATELNSKYFTEDYFTKKYYPLSILKIEKKGTRFVEGVFADIPVSNCIYIDIFPLDNIWEPAYKLQTAILIKLQSVRDFKTRPHENAGKLKKILYTLMPLKLNNLLTEFFMRFFNIFPTKKVNQLCHRGRHWPKFYVSDVNNLTTLTFEGKEYPVPVNYDKMLTECYGNYMELPPEEQREPIHNVMECVL